MINPIEVYYDKIYDSYIIINGYYRYYACVELGIDYIPCNIIGIKPNQILKYSIDANKSVKRKVEARIFPWYKIGISILIGLNIIMIVTFFFLPPTEFYNINPWRPVVSFVIFIVNISIWTIRLIKTKNKMWF